MNFEIPEEAPPIAEAAGIRGKLAGPTMIDVVVRDGCVHVTIFVQPRVDPEKVRKVLTMICPKIFGRRSVAEVQTYSKLVKDEIERYGHAIPVMTGDDQYQSIDSFEVHLSEQMSRPYINKLGMLQDAFVSLLTKHLRV